MGYRTFPWFLRLVTPSLRDVSPNIDTDGAALPPARCDISTLADFFHFRVPINRTIVQCQSIAYRGVPFPGSW